MGNKQRFRLSHMIPNAWFYRLRDMNTLPHTTTTSKTTSFCHTPKLYSSPNNRNRPPVPKNVLGSIYIRPTESTHDSNQDLFISPGNSCYESPLYEFDIPSSTAVHDVKFETKRIQDSCRYQDIQLPKPPQIITRLSKTDASTKQNEESVVSIEIVKENISKNDCLNPGRKKTRSKCSKKIVVDDENKFSSSFCLVKSTFEPCKELRESMMGMIVDYNIRASKDLEKLLAYYLSLNSNEYHDMIVKVFEEVWLTFDFIV